MLSPATVEPSISRLLLLVPSWPLRPALSGGRMLLPSAIVLLDGKLKLIVTDPPESDSRFAWWMQYRRSPLVPLPTPRPVGLASVVAVTVNVCADAAAARRATAAAAMAYVGERMAATSVWA